ncbi:unnamed protein product [Moneuplotes crassus]|uniref:NADP-dependent oxidoreductase domain-containing protein n=2 Tax=Euplotes crassus TaxID=5936 RepID=A0AAD1XHN6_EUPCR|nr:unnamed protein product [Moneuplotes crassus]
MAEEHKGSKMIYRHLGNTGLKVSLLSFGTMLAKYTEEDQENWLKCAKAAYDAGVNYFDSAEMYGGGKGDSLLGRAIKEFEWDRDRIVVSVKIMFGGTGPNDGFMSRKHIIEGTKDSLKRMGLDYCDLVFSHRPDYETPLEETCRAFSWLIDKGYAKYWCTSTWPADYIERAIGVCKEFDLHLPIADQCEYSMLERNIVEKDYVRLFKEYGYGTTIWSPLCKGLLTGKYKKDVIPEGTRFARNPVFKMGGLDMKIAGKEDQVFGALDELQKIAEEQKCEMAELALAWTLVNRDVSTCIFGASKLSQIESNLKALEIAANWTSELEEQINKALGNQPQPEMILVKLTPEAPRRSVSMTYDLKLGGIDKQVKI